MCVNISKCIENLISVKLCFAHLIVEIQFIAYDILLYCMTVCTILSMILSRDTHVWCFVIFSYTNWGGLTVTSS